MVGNGGAPFLRRLQLMTQGDRSKNTVRKAPQLSLWRSCDSALGARAVPAHDDHGHIGRRQVWHTSMRKVTFTEYYMHPNGVWSKAYLVIDPDLVGNIACGKPDVGSCLLCMALHEPCMA